jgi:hypothetical protein
MDNTQALNSRIGWAKKEICERWATIMTELGIPYELSSPTTSEEEAEGRALTDRYEDEEIANMFRVHDDWGLYVTDAIAAAWLAGKEAAKSAPKSESTAVRRAALAKAATRS